MKENVMSKISETANIASHVVIFMYFYVCLHVTTILTIAANIDHQILAINKVYTSPLPWLITSSCDVISASVLQKILLEIIYSIKINKNEW